MRSSSEADSTAIMAADQAFYTALSARDLKAMAAVWANKPYVINIGPRSKAMTVGYEATVKYWEGAFNFFSRMTVTKGDAHIQSDGRIAWAVGLERAALQPRTGGDELKFETFVTHIFEREGDRWLLVLHHSQMMQSPDGNYFKVDGV